MSNVNWNSADWVWARVTGEHHQALTSYLIGRTGEQAKALDEDGLTASDIVRKAFDVKNGHSTVPKCAIRLVRNRVPGLDLSLVIALCRASREATGHILELGKALAKIGDHSDEAKAVIDEATVREVMDS